MRRIRTIEVRRKRRKRIAALTIAGAVVVLFLSLLLTRLIPLSFLFHNKDLNSQTPPTVSADAQPTPSWGTGEQPTPSIETPIDSSKEPTIAPGEVDSANSGEQPSSTPYAITGERSNFVAQLSIDIYNMRANGSMLIWFVNNTEQPMYSIPLAVNGASINAITLNGVAVSFINDTQSVAVTIVDPIAPNERACVYIDFSIPFAWETDGMAKILLPGFAYQTEYDMILYMDVAIGVMPEFSHQPVAQQAGGANRYYTFELERITEFYILVKQYQ